MEYIGTLKVFNPKIALVYSNEPVQRGDFYLTSENRIARCQQVLAGLVYGENDHPRNPSTLKKVLVRPNQLTPDTLRKINAGELLNGMQVVVNGESVQRVNGI
jgi:hypothetical protein